MRETLIKNPPVAQLVRAQSLYLWGPWFESKQVDIYIMNPQEILEQVKNKEAIILDVRTIDEWNEGHVDGAVHFDIVKIMNGEKVPIFDKDICVYTYCRSGGRASTALYFLEQQGFEKCVCIGGYLDWKEKGGPVVE